MPCTAADEWPASFCRMSGATPWLASCETKWCRSEWKLFELRVRPFFPPGSETRPVTPALRMMSRNCADKPLRPAVLNPGQTGKDVSLGYASGLTSKPVKKPRVQWNDDDRAGFLRLKAKQASFQIQCFPPEVGDVAEPQTRCRSQQDCALPVAFRVGNQRGDFVTGERFPTGCSRFRPVLYRINGGAGIYRDMAKPIARWKKEGLAPPRARAFVVLAVRPSARSRSRKETISFGEIAVSGAFDRPPRWARNSSSTLRYRAVTRSPALAFLFDSHSSNHPRTVCADICSPDEIATISAISLRPCAAVSSLRRAFMAALFEEQAELKSLAAVPVLVDFFNRRPSAATKLHT